MVQGLFGFGLRLIGGWFGIYLGMVYGSFSGSFRGLFGGYLGLLFLRGIGVSLGLFRDRLGLLWGKVQILVCFEGFSWTCISLLGDGLSFFRVGFGVYLYCASWGLFRHKEQISRKEQRSRTVKKQ